MPTISPFFLFFIFDRAASTISDHLATHSLAEYFVYTAAAATAAVEHSSVSTFTVSWVGLCSELTRRHLKPPQLQPPIWAALSFLTTMEPLCASHSNENSLTVERESFQSTSAPTSPTKIPISVMSMNMIAISQNASGDSSAESTASADNLHSRSTFGTDLTNRHKSHRSVKFPEDNAIVTGYHYPDPYRYGKCLTVSALSAHSSLVADVTLDCTPC